MWFYITVTIEETGQQSHAKNCLSSSTSIRMCTSELGEPWDGALATSHSRSSKFQLI